MSSYFELLQIEDWDLIHRYNGCYSIEIKTFISVLQ